MSHPDYYTVILPVGDGVAISQEEVKNVKKPELLVTPLLLKIFIPLIEAGADAFVIGEQRYGLRLAGEFSRRRCKAGY